MCESVHVCVFMFYDRLLLGMQQMINVLIILTINWKW